MLRRNRGFTLIELLVVIAIIAVSSPCSCPRSSRRARPPAGRSVSTTSSKSGWQFTTTIPRTTLCRQLARRNCRSASDGGQLKNAWSCKSRILPYMEQQATYNSANLSLDPEWSWGGGVDNGGWEVSQRHSQGDPDRLVPLPFRLKKGNRGNRSSIVNAARQPDVSQTSNYCENIGGNRWFYDGQPNGYAYFHGSTDPCGRAIRKTDSPDP